MTLLFPAALASLAVLGPIIVAFYLRRVRRQAATVSTLMFWERVLAEQPRRAFLGRLRRVLSLLLQLLLLALLALALARPEVAGVFGYGAGNATAMVLVVDARAPMRTREAGGRTRFEHAVEAARGFARRAGPRHAVAVLAVAGPAPRLVGPLSEDDRSALAAIDGVRATDAGGSLEPALELAGGLLAARPAGETRRILVFTDRGNLPPEVAGVPVETVAAADPGAARENVGIGRFGVRPRPDSPQTFAASGSVFNAGTRRQRGEAELSLDGRLLDVQPFDLAPGEQRALSFPALATSTGLANARGWLRLRVRRAATEAVGPEDSLASDDEARAVLPPARPLRVLLVSRGNWFLENLLKADAGVSFDLLEPGAFRPETAGGFDAVLLDDVPAPRPDALPATGNFLFLRQTPFDEPGAPPLLRPLVAEADPASPLLRLTDWRAVTVARAGALPPVDPPAAAEAVLGGWRLAAPVRAAEGDRPLILTGERRGTDGRTQRLVALPFALTEGDLPLRVAFPLFMANTVRWLSGADRPDAAAPANFRAGDTLTVAAGETLWIRPQTEPRPLPDTFPAAERLVGPGVFQPLENGFYLLRRSPANGGDRWLAVNTDTPEDVALNDASASSSARATAPNPAVAAVGWWETMLRARPPWIALVLAAFVLSSLEWGLFHRRRTE